MLVQHVGVERIDGGPRSVIVVGAGIVGICVWGVLAAWEPGVWLLMACTLIGPMLVAGVMYLMYYGVVNFADGFVPGRRQRSLDCACQRNFIGERRHVRNVDYE